MWKVLLPDGTRVSVGEWTHYPLFSACTHFLLEALPVLIQPGYTIGPGEEPPAPITLQEFARRSGQSEWAVRCALTECRNLKRKGRRSHRVWMRLTRFAFSLPLEETK